MPWKSRGQCAFVDDSSLTAFGARRPAHHVSQTILKNCLRAPQRRRSVSPGPACPGCVGLCIKGRRPVWRHARNHWHLHPAPAVTACPGLYFGVSWSWCDTFSKRRELADTVPWRAWDWRLDEGLTAAGRQIRTGLNGTSGASDRNWIVSRSADSPVIQLMIEALAKLCDFELRAA